MVCWEVKDEDWCLDKEIRPDHKLILLLSFLVMLFLEDLKKLLVFYGLFLDVWGLETVVDSKNELVGLVMLLVKLLLFTNRLFGLCLTGLILPEN